MAVKYGLEIEDAGGNLSAYLPDVLGVAVTGATVEEIVQRIQIAAKWHIDGLIEDGEPIPLPRADRGFDHFVEIVLPERFVGIQYVPADNGARELLLA